MHQQLPSLRRTSRRLLFAGVALAAMASVAFAAQVNTRWIVDLKPESQSVSARSAGEPQIRVQKLAQRLGGAFPSARPFSKNSFTFTLDANTSDDEQVRTIAAMRGDPAVNFVEPDRRRRHNTLRPNDPLFGDSVFVSTQPSGLWHLKSHTAEVSSAINAEAAWSYSQGSSSVVIAVLDSGVLFDHPDLGRVATGGRLLGGYDFVSEDSPGSYVSANDGSDWDADPSDPGDWINATLIAAHTNVLSDCTEEDSSWHGTRTAGIIGAIAQNSTGIAGVDWQARILPVRVLGRCGGYTSDIVAGIRWAAGLPVAGVPNNPNPARVINLSLGGSGACSQSEQAAINEVLALGAVVVASAGNAGGSVESPGNCLGVIAVGGLRHNGTKVGYSSLGPEVSVSAPAGNCVNVGFGEPCLYSIDTTTNSGATSPAINTYTDQINSNVGTSFSAPLVAGVAGLMLGINPSLTPAEVKTALETTSRPFPAAAGLQVCPAVATSGDNTGQCNCMAGQCGAGMLDALAAVQAINPSECLFRWAERTVPTLLPDIARTEINGPYQFRFYPSTNSYLGVSSETNKVLYLTDSALLDLGPRDGWYRQSGCYNR